MEIAFAIREANEAISGLTLGQICAFGVVSLEVQCYRCPRRGRYRVTRLIDQYGAGQGLPELIDLWTTDCPKRGRTAFYDQCGAYCPKLEKIS